MSGKTYSLRRRLLTLISVPIIMAGLLIGGTMMAFLYHEIGEVYDAQLVESAKLLMQLTEHELEEPEEHGLSLGAENQSLSHFYEKKTSFRIWKDGRLVTESASAKGFEEKPGSPGFSLRYSRSGETRWRTFTYIDQSTGISIETAEDYRVRSELIFQLMGTLFLPAFVFVPLIMLLVWQGTTRSLRPIVSLAQQVNRRGVGDSTPLQTKDVPEEIIPFTAALDRLFRRVEDALRRQREFTDNAAHELRTPLAAMKMQAQVLLKKAKGLPDCEEGLNNLLASIDRAAHLVNQLLSFARIQNLHEDSEELDLSSLTREVLAEMYPALLSRNQTIDVAIIDKITIKGSQSAISILVRNLVDNAAKHTPVGGHISVRLAQQNNRAVLEVQDDGSGIPAELREKVFERFYRVDKSQGAGSGLGLAMVRWVAETHHASIELADTQPHGLVVRIVF
jgi:signal transduction histidine kinase